MPATAPTPVTVPRLGWSMEEGTFVDWLKKDGDDIRMGDALFVLESDKAAETIEAIDTGILRIPADAPRPGDKVQVGQTLAYLVSADSEAPPAVTTMVPKSATELVVEKGPQVKPSAAHTHATKNGEDRAEKVASPRARRVARELGVDWKTLQGSGKNGRVRERDVRAASGVEKGRVVPHTNVRRLIATRMVAGVTQAAPVTLTTTVDVRQMIALRERRRTAKTDVPTYTDIVVMCVAATLREHPLLQAQWREEGLFVPEEIHIAVAVDVETGLTAPVVRNADKLTLDAIAQRSRQLIAVARTGKLTLDDLRSATFTVSNLGMYGIDAFTPIITLPQCAVLGIGRIQSVPTIVENGILARPHMTLSLTFDHRIVDGAPAARFLQTVAGKVNRVE